MRAQYNHDLIASMVMWLDNRLTNKGQAYINVPSGTLVRQGGPGNWFYSSPYKSWVYDTCVSGALIPSGVYNASGQYLTPSSGIVIDYIDGRVYSNANWGPTLTSSYARKEVSVYFSSSEQIKYVMEAAYGTNSNLAYAFTGAEKSPLQAPLALMTNDWEQNDPWSLGGTDITRNTITALVVTKDNYLQDGISSLCRDSAHTYVPFASFGDMPIAASGTTKTIPWSYCTGIRDVYGCNRLYIESVYAQKINERANQNSSFYLMTVEWDLSLIRDPNAGS